MIGRLVAERLEIISLLGKGGMSAVYKAKHLLLNRIVAVKIIQKMDSNAVLRFKQEAKAASSLSHPNIAAVREFGVDEEGNPYLVMDFVDGLTLQQLIKKNGRLSTERTTSIVSQICSGLEHAHSLNIVHRDLKPANIIITRSPSGDDLVKIVDFGIAKIIEEEGQSSVTQTGEIFGTPNYMSPEQGQGHRVDLRSDLYSVGCIMFECLTESPPFTGANAIEIILKHTSAELPSFKSLNVVSKLEPVVRCCMAKDPANRYQNAMELNADLHAAEPKTGLKRSARKLSVKQKIVFAALATFLISGLFLFLSIWPVLNSIFFPKPWEQLSRDAAGQTSNGISNYESAKSSLLKAIDAAEAGGASNQDKENLYGQLARLYSGTSDWKNAIRFFEKALALNALHAVDRQSGSMHDWLSEAYNYDKQYDNAVEHGETAVQIKKRLLGAKHEHTLFALLHLGQAYRGARRSLDAEKIDREALSLAKELYPSGDSPNLADSYHQLANILADLGNTSEAIDNYKMSLEVSIKARGSQSPMVEKERAFLEAYMKRHPKPKS